VLLANANAPEPALELDALALNAQPLVANANPLLKRLMIQFKHAKTTA